MGGLVHFSSQLHALEVIVILDFAELTTSLVHDAVAVVPLLLVAVSQKRVAFTKEYGGFAIFCLIICSFADIA